MLEHLLELERDWFLAINGTHTGWLDHVMLFFGGVWIWCPLVLVPLYFAFKKSKEFLPVLICTILTVFINWVVTSLFFKPLFARLRPTGHPSFTDHVRILDNYIAGGEFGFISGHTTNAFAFAVMSSLILKNKWYSLIIYVWAFVMAYSRIYLGAHFISDVVPGILVGSFIGWMLYWLYKYICNKQEEYLKQ